MAIHYSHIVQLKMGKSCMISSGKIVTYKREFIDNVRFMASSLPSLAENLAKGITRLNVKNISLVFSIPWSKTTR